MDPIPLKCTRCGAVAVFHQNSQDQVCCRAVVEGRICGARVFQKTRSPDTVVRLK